MDGSPTMREDDIPTVVHEEWALATVRFEGPEAYGPVPVLFAEDPEEARASLDNFPATFSKELEKLAKR